MNTMKVFKVDLLSIRPYLTIKNLIIIIGLGTLYGVLSKNPITIQAAMQIFAILFSGYPFMVGEEAGIDPLYKLFGIDSKDVVKGRYLLAALFVGVMLIIGIILALLIAIIWPMEDLYRNLLLSAPVTGFVASFIIFIEYPIYFRYGYKKGKTLAIIPFLLIGIAAACSAFFGEHLQIILQLFLMHKFIGAGMLFGIWAVVLLLSFQISKKTYSERDF